jgi:hypothetical protein
MTDIRETRAKAAGAIRKVGAVLKGDVGIVQRLKEEHGELTSLMHQVSAAGAGPEAVEVRRALFPKIRRELISHGRAEERELYLVLELFDDTREIAERCGDEHAAVEQLVEHLAQMSMEPSSWFDVFEQVRMRVEHHIEEEESKVFAILDERLDPVRAALVERRYADEKEVQLRVIDEEDRRRAEVV